MKSDTGRHNISIMHTGLAARIFHAVARDEGERERARERDRTTMLLRGADLVIARAGRGLRRVAPDIDQSRPFSLKIRQVFAE